MNEKELHMMIGGIGTGKSTYSHKLAKEIKCKIFSEDEIVEEYDNERKKNKSNQKQNVKELIDAEFKRQLKSGENFIIDGKYLSTVGRKIIIDNAKKEGYTIIGYDFGAGNVISLLRRLRNPRKFAKEIWENVHENDKSTYETPEIEEGFEKIYIPEKS